MASGGTDGALDADSKVSEWVMFLREPEFEPELEIEAADDC